MAFEPWAFVTCKSETYLFHINQPLPLRIGGSAELPHGSAELTLQICLDTLKYI
jgi:hypothetical protein